MKKYFCKTTKTGAEFKTFMTGVDFLHDNQKYRLELEADGLWKCLKLYWRIIRKKPIKFSRTREGL